MGLREIKKQQTRTAIADAALTLFMEHGFDQVTVAQVAQHAGVSTNTVFNYFPAKEDLFFDRQAEVEGHLATLVRDRPPGACPVEIIRDDLLSALQQDDPMLGLHPGALRFWQVIHDSPALRAREREIGERAEAALATALAQHPPRTASAPNAASTSHAASAPNAASTSHTNSAPNTASAPNGSDQPMPALLAGAIAGAHRAVLREIQRRVMSGELPARARNTVAPAALQAFNLLCSGLHTGL
ncbi:TetR/AcrR family transcriptional regulator [Streptomyces sp. NPDC001634]|uniref:TetR/AcrR family transcriptional regulator n=1 Tax=Streptomyces sp. NPDC001634 TaxID=3154390 RepID=UPI00333488AC